ncbi:tRNA-queuosine alpha-mannosyltransferase domain-containing protein [Endozoicomonas elysicola]|uniref:tRNA-queuosine alpha-mannosyltransferase n=1 Tax=Endozoicomonas elysicola TaxID=305900 RepID=A0A081KDN6_9GAMM|nr:DUF3524 domain-containing protein [Endozoicomonas elysicola]KEI72262.1 glycosyl transferase family 1 [Endozoicomonas elysicola]
MKILLLSAYDALSHQYWRKGLVGAFPEYDWTVLTLPPRYFSWRLRGNSLTWAYSKREVLSAGYDLLICTSMTDLSALKGMVPALAAVPVLCYFHENQFAYPASEQQNASVEPLMLNLYTALAADKVLFNSVYNRQTFFAGVRRLLKKLPDYVPGNILDLLQEKSAVLPVPLPNDVYLGKVHDTSDVLQIVFNHRWEYDKAPERMLQALKILKSRKVPFRVHVVGQGFRQIPPAFSEMRSVLSEQIGCWGFIESVDEYRSLLQKSDAVLSTAIHDFQGIAVLEAVAAGCVPVVPERLAYPELFAKRFRYPSFEKDAEKEAETLAGRLEKMAKAKAGGELLVAPDIKALGWRALRPFYQQWIRDTAKV